MVTKGEALEMLAFGSILSSAFDGEWQQQLEAVAGGSLKCYKSVQILGSWTLTPVYLLRTSRELGFLSPCQCLVL